jgi:hypothetical protein
MRSELPEVTRARHHPIVMLRPPGKWAALGFLLLLVWARFSSGIAIVVLLVLLTTLFIRWQTWQAEQIILTRKRIIRVRGVPETTSSEAFLRVDRISGIRIVQSVPGKLLDYATIELEAPGNHPDVRRMVKVWHPHDFYRHLRHLAFTDDRAMLDPDDVGSVAAQFLPPDATQPLPRLGPPPGGR